MAEIKDLVKIGIAGVALGLVALIVAGFYFTITGATGQGFLVGQFELFAEAIFNFIASPFIAFGKIITDLPHLIGLWIIGGAV